MRAFIAAALLLPSQVLSAAPTVSLTAPANNASYLAPLGSVLLQATASVSGSATITNVKFFANNVLIGTDTTSPYTFNWQNVPAGSYVLQARATDSTGAITNSATRTITVTGTNTPPNVQLTSPPEGSIYLAPASFIIGGAVSGPELNDSIQRIEVSLNGVLAGTTTSPSSSWALHLSNIAPGTYAATAKAVDSRGGETTSAPLMFTVAATNTPPTVSLGQPLDNSYWHAPATLTISASATDLERNDGVARVEFYANQILLGTDTTSPYQINTTLPAGNYVLTAKAIDGQGAATISSSRTIAVSDTNIPPTVTIVGPVQGANYPKAPAGIMVRTYANAVERNGSILRVEFYLNGNLVGTDSSAGANGGYDQSLSSLAAGTYTVVAKAVDQLNAEGFSDPITFTVGAEPKLLFIHTDHLNTPRAIFDANQQVRWKWDQQEPFGVNPPDENPAGAGAFEFPGRFPGQYADRETNLIYNYLREYDPGLGRYRTSDPLGLRAGVNTYAYVHLDPLGLSDSYGLVEKGFSTRHGNWCGRNWSGGQVGHLIPKNPAGPVDSVDECCMNHDYCYAEIEGCKTCPQEEDSPEKLACDRTLIKCANDLKGKPPHMWPKPPTKDRPEDVYFYCQKMKKYFQFKVGE